MDGKKSQGGVLFLTIVKSLHLEVAFHDAKPKENNRRSVMLFVSYIFSSPLSLFLWILHNKSYRLCFTGTIGPVIVLDFVLRVPEDPKMIMHFCPFFLIRFGSNDDINEIWTSNFYISWWNWYNIMSMKIILNWNFS